MTKVEFCGTREIYKGCYKECLDEGQFLETLGPLCRERNE